jgi:hypothetical protein
MDFDKTLKTLTETRLGDNLPLIPDCRKENMYFQVDNDKRSKTTKRQFTDECGAWQKSSLKTHYYLKSNFCNFEYIYKKQSIFFMRKNGSMVPLNPQPDLDSLVILQVVSYHSKLKKDKNYQRRVNWFQNFPNHDDIQLIYIFEYIGNNPGDMPHGLAKNTTQSYKRVTLGQKSTIADGLKAWFKTLNHSKQIAKIRS